MLLLPMIVSCQAFMLEDKKDPLYGMECTPVGVAMQRCVNEEVVCYTYYSSAVSCKFLGPEDEYEEDGQQGPGMGTPDLPGLSGPEEYVQAV